MDFFFLLIYFRNCCARLIFNFLPVIFYLFLVYINYQTIMNIRNKLGFFRGISNACLIYLALQFFLKQWLLEQPLCVYANFSSPRVCVGLNFHFLPVLTKCLAYIGALHLNFGQVWPADIWLAKNSNVWCQYRPTTLLGRVKNGNLNQCKL